MVSYNPLGPPGCPLPSADPTHLAHMLWAYGSAPTGLPTFRCQCHSLPFSPHLWEETATTEQRGRETQAARAPPAEMGQSSAKGDGYYGAGCNARFASFISSSNFREEAELCQTQGCPRREEVAQLSSFPARVCCLPPKSAVAWSTRGAHGHTQIRHVPLSSRKQEQPSHNGAGLITEGGSSGEPTTGSMKLSQNLWPNSPAGMDQRSVAGRHSSMSCTLPELLSHTIPLGVCFTDMKFHTFISPLCHHILSFTP